MKKSLSHWLPAFLMMALIFAFSSIPSSEMPNFNWADLLVKKGGHMLGYALLAAAFWWGMECDDSSRRGVQGSGSAVWSLRAPFFLAWGLAVLYAASDEFHQSFVPGRHASPLDVLIDAVGAGIGLTILAWIVKRSKDAADQRS